MLPTPFHHFTARSETTPLLTVEEGLEAMRRGGEVAQLYRPPAG